MVQKTSYRGVYSGNTLRASNTLYNRRYHRQGCIVSRVHPKLLHKLLTADRPDKHPDKDLIEGPQNAPVNVALSLNKQGRWLLPGALIRQVESGDVFAGEDLTVSVLERHKLKRPACCVSFHSNHRGEVKRVQPRGGRYFSFRYPDPQGRSRRAQRRQRREELQQLLRGNKAGSPVAKTVEVYTLQGNVAADLQCGESEVRYEVYYPCPTHSSISHNPKYIKQDLEAAPGSDNDHVQHGKAKRRHRGKQRQRLAVKDLDECDWPQYDAVILQEILADSREEDVLGIERSSDETPKFEEGLLSSLIDKAERLQQAVRRGGRLPRTRPRRCRNNSSSTDEDLDKSHIIYMENPENEAQHPPRKAGKKLEVQNTSEEVSFKDVPSTRVVLPVDDVTVVSLKEYFGESYIEAACKPRKFLLNFTENVRELMQKKSKNSGKSEESIQEAQSYVVFIHDGFYDNEHDVYKIFLNCRLRPGLLPIPLSRETYTDIYKGTIISLISQIVDFIERLLTDVTLKSSCKVLLGTKRQLTRHIGQTEAYIPSLQHVLHQEPPILTPTLPTMEEMLSEEPAFCDVCYDDVSPMTSESAASTSLLKCRHTVCDRCWAQHIHSRFQQGFVRFTCPGYDCQEEVSAPVLLSLVSMGTVEKIVQRQEEVRLGASLTEKWCPSQSCGRVLRLHTGGSSDQVTRAELQRDVICPCGAHVCFGCLEPAHWPATCVQAADYRHRIATTAFPDREAEVHVDQAKEKDDELARKLEAEKAMMMEGKHCPKCRSFVYKDGGCAQMTCRCGTSFCWFCRKPGIAHHDRKGCVTVMEEKLTTTTVIVRHFDNDSNGAAVAAKQEDTTVKRHQRMSFLEKAVDHRRRRLSRNTPRHVIRKISKAVATAASKDERVAQHVLEICLSSCSTSATLSSSSSTKGSLNSDVYPSIGSTITTFLENVISSKSQLHELTEYTLVLVKDLPDSLLKRRTLRISEDLGAFCSFVQSVLDAWTNVTSVVEKQQEAVKALTRLAEIQHWIASALAVHIVTVGKIRNHMDK